MLHTANMKLSSRACLRSEDIKVSAYESDEEQDEKIGNTLVRHMYRSIYVLPATNTMDEIMAMVKKHQEDNDVEMKIEESSSS